MIKFLFTKAGIAAGLSVLTLAGYITVIDYVAPVLKGAESYQDATVACASSMGLPCAAGVADEWAQKRPSVEAGIEQLLRIKTFTQRAISTATATPTPAATPATTSTASVRPNIPTRWISTNQLSKVRKQVIHAEAIPAGNSIPDYDKIVWTITR